VPQTEITIEENKNKRENLRSIGSSQKTMESDLRPLSQWKFISIEIKLSKFFLSKVSTFTLEINF